ncbi:MAG: response regulator [Chitinispirillaceae bacterium]|nr:response regulator [Chitinispirillaceae bacterium]
MSHRMLELLNYEVMSAATPGETIVVMNEYGDRIDLVLSDVIMPEMNGRELIGRLRKTRPDFKFLFMSGYTDDIVIPKGTLREEGALFIQKPFSRREIANRLRKILEPE